MSSIQLRKRGLQHCPALGQLNHGIERESLRVTSSGSLSHQTHPEAFGSPLTHPAITTDFSEAQLELITDVHQNVNSCLRELRDIHLFVHQHLDEEILWSASMPCGVKNESDIPIARYGSSNAARFKEIYRNGLALRYGRVMQTISGIHYNFSVPDAIWDVLAKVDGTSSDQAARNEGYLRLMRNFRRHGWLLIFLFGASPAVCRSFLRGREHQLEDFDATTCFLPHATSLRMGPLGYQSTIQSRHRVLYDSLPEFIESMLPVLLEPYSAYHALGLKNESGQQQLTDALLQVEAEFYGTIRAKRKPVAGERALLALHRHGIQYVEVRCLDIDPFVPLGISEATARFMDVFLLHSLLADNDAESAEQASHNLENQLAVVHEGRDPNLTLRGSSGPVKLVDWANELLAECSEIAAMVDEVEGGTDCQKEVRAQLAKVSDSSLTPSAKLLDLMSSRNQPFASLGLELAYQHHEAMQRETLPESQLAQFQKLALQSDAERAAIEASDRLKFDDYLEEALSMHELN